MLLRSAGGALQAAFAEPRKMAATTRDTSESEWFDRVRLDVGDRVLDRVGGVNQFQIGSAYHPSPDHFIDESGQFAPIIRSHHNAREVFDLAGLIEREGLE